MIDDHEALTFHPLPPNRLYIAGPMTGIEGLNFPAFHAEAARLRALGYEVVNPAEVNPDTSMKWADCMRTDIAELVKCDGIVLLPGWKNSKGATLEQHIAERLEMTVIELIGDDMDERKSVLTEAQGLVHGARNADYGHPLDDFSRTAGMASAMLAHKLKEPLTAEEVGMFMCCVKLSRQMNSPKRDSMVDLAGYAETIQWCIDERKVRQE